MDIKKSDTSKKQDSIKNREKINKIVEEIMSNEVTKKPFDYLFRKNVNSYPQTNHNLLKLPGKFKNKENTGVFIKGKKSMEMDFAESILPDGKMIKREAAINLEQETGEIRDNKIDSIFNYCLSTTIALKKPCYPFVATNYEYKENFLVREIEGIILKIYLIIFDKKKIYEILNTLNKKDYTKENFDEVDYLLFIYILVFAKKPYAQEVIENLVTLFQSLNNIHQDYQLELYLALAVMIKYHFRGNNDKIKEMLTMITEVMQEEVVDELPTEDKKTLEIIELNGKVTKLNGTVNELHGEVNELNGEVNELNGKLSEKDKIIKELRQEIEQYKNK